MFAVNNHIQRARLLLQQGRLRDAEKEVGFALRENPDDAEALLLLAECKVDGRQYGPEADRRGRRRTQGGEKHRRSAGGAPSS